MVPKVRTVAISGRVDIDWRGPDKTLMGSASVLSLDQGPGVALMCTCVRSHGGAQLNVCHSLIKIQSVKCA